MEREDFRVDPVDLDEQEAPKETYFKFTVLLEGHIRFDEADVKLAEAQRRLVDAILVYPNEKYGPHVVVDSSTYKADLAVPRRGMADVLAGMFRAPRHD